MGVRVRDRGVAVALDDGSHLTAASNALQSPIQINGSGDVYAIIEDSGTQIRVAKGDVMDIDLREVGPRSKKIKFDRVLLVGETGVAPTIGTPYVSGATVSAEILEEVKGDKIDVIKFKRRKGYRRKTGHTQRYLRIRIEEITGGAASKTKPRTKKKTTKTADDA